MLQVGEDPVLSQPVTLQLAAYFAFAHIVSVTERTLSTIHDVSFLARNKVAPPGHNPPESRLDPANGFATTLLPSQIRTFFVQFAPN